MKKILMLGLVVCGIYTHAMGDVLLKLISPDGKPTATLQQLFRLVGCSAELLGDIVSLNRWAQDNLLRKGERWEAQPETPVSAAIKSHEEEIRTLLRELGMFEQALPPKTQYTYVLVLGGLARRVQDRLAFLEELQRLGYEWKVIVLVGSDRALNKDEKEEFPTEIITESAMMRELLTRDPRLNAQKYIVVSAPSIINSDGTVTRATTDSSLAHFAQAYAAGPCIVVSNNPFAGRQGLVAERVLEPKRFSVAVAGSAASDQDIRNVRIVLDELARTVYELSKRAEIKK